MKKLVVVALVVVLGAVAAPAQALTPPQTRPDGVTGLLSPSIDAFWARTLAAAGKSYTSPTGVHWYTGTTSSACGLLAPGNSFYCASGNDRRIYLDWGWHWSLIERFGDYGSGFVLAHEWGHHVQKLLGWYDWALERRYYAGLELQADCYAGIYSGHAYDIGLFTADDYEEALAWLRTFGDEHHWQSPYAHGQPWLRQTSFEYGFEHMSVAGCDLSYQRLYGTDARPKPAAKKAKLAKKKPRAKRR